MYALSVILNPDARVGTKNLLNARDNGILRPPPAVLRMTVFPIND
jgi:hypothetical protein